MCWMRWAGGEGPASGVGRPGFYARPNVFEVGTGVVDPVALGVLWRHHCRSEGVMEAMKLRRREDGSTEANAAEVLKENWAAVVRIVQPPKPPQNTPPPKPNR